MVQHYKDRVESRPTWRFLAIAVAALTLVVVTAASIQQLVKSAATQNERALAAQRALAEANELQALEARIRAGESIKASTVHMTAMNLASAVDAAFGKPPRPEVASLVHRVGLFCDLAVNAAKTNPNVVPDAPLMLMDPGSLTAFTGNITDLFDQVNGDLRQVAADAKSEGEEATKAARLGAVVIAAVSMGALAGALLVVRRKHRERLSRIAARRAELRFQALVSRAPDLLMVIDDAGLRYSSPSLAKLLGFGDRPLHLDALKDQMTNDGRVAFNEALKRVRAGSTEETATIELSNVEGHIRLIDAIVSNHQDDAELHAIVINARDVTERVELQRRLQYEATHDPLTGLSNRRSFETRLQAAIDRAAIDADRSAALLVLDLDGFKGVNDSLGHAAGDSLLEAFSARIANLSRADETVARLGGDEFAVIIEGVATLEEAQSAARRLTRSLWDPFPVGDELLSVKACGGLAMVGAETLDAAELMRRADTALYRAKRLDRGNVVTYTEECDADGLEISFIQKELARALQNHQISVAYQPVVDPQTGKLTACEALARWTHPTCGAISPERFVAVAERSDLILKLGAGVRETAFAQLVEWRERCDGAASLQMSVNVSISELLHDDFVEQLVAAVQRHGLRPGDIIVEITEHLIDNRIEAAGAALARLRARGFTLALDDFGVAPTSIQQLQHLRVDVLKLDRCLMTGVGERDHRDELIAALVGFANRLGLRILVEGVETDQQMVSVQRAGCHEVQGALVSMPLPPAEFELLLPRWLESSGRLTPADAR